MNDQTLRFIIILESLATSREPLTTHALGQRLQQLGHPTTLRSIQRSIETLSREFWIDRDNQRYSLQSRLSKRLIRSMQVIIENDAHRTSECA